MPDNKLTAELILEYLNSNPGLDTRDLAGVFGVTYDSMRRRFLKKMHNSGQIYISDWRVEPGHHIACYSAGSKEDAPVLLVGTKRVRRHKPKSTRHVVIKPVATVIQIKYQPVIDPLTAYVLGIAA